MPATNTITKAKATIATIDCSLVTIETSATYALTSDVALNVTHRYYTKVGNVYTPVYVPVLGSIATYYEKSTVEFGFDTANQIQVEPQIETEDAVKLVIKGVLRAQKPAISTITGNEITLTDNVFNPELVLALQGGSIVYDSVVPTKIIGYVPPASGSVPFNSNFALNAYSAQYNSAGNIVQYEKIIYPNCKGQPIAFGSEDGVFRAPEYVISSAPSEGQAPYEIVYVTALPTLT